MKKIVFLLVAIVSATNLLAKKVTFTVNMTGQSPISAFGIHIMGDFQAVAGFGADWTPNTCLMTQDATDTNLYHFTTDIPAFAKYEYKFINGEQSYEVEVVPLQSQVGYNFDDNRWIYIDSLNADTTKLPAVVFSANAPLGLNMIRFLVDMTSSPYNAAGVHVAGNFQGNDPSTDRLYSFGNNVFEIISYMPLGNYTYKFYNGNTTGDSETVPAGCAVSGERTIPLTKDTVLANVCFSSCATCYPTLVDNTALHSSVDIFPNPMTSQTAIHFNDGQTLHHVELTDFCGRKVIKEMNVHGPLLALGHYKLAKGMYTAAILDNRGNRTSAKLMVD